MFTLFTSFGPFVDELVSSFHTAAEDVDRKSDNVLVKKLSSEQKIHQVHILNAHRTNLAYIPHAI